MTIEFSLSAIASDDDTNSGLRPVELRRDTYSNTVILSISQDSEEIYVSFDMAEELAQAILAIVEARKLFEED